MSVNKSVKRCQYTQALKGRKKWCSLQGTLRRKLHGHDKKNRNKRKVRDPKLDRVKTVPKIKGIGNWMLLPRMVSKPFRKDKLIFIEHLVYDRHCVTWFISFRLHQNPRRNTTVILPLFYKWSN